MSARTRALFRLAWRESRTARRRLLLYMSSICLGVAALVAIDSFAGNVTRSIRSQSRSLLGGDVALSSRQGWPAAADTLLDSLRGAGVPSAKVTTFASMAVVARTGNTRLVQVRAITAGYPFYGEVTTQPAGQWARLAQGSHALVDPSLLIALDARVGDTIKLGFGQFRVLGTLESVPGDPGVAAAIGPRVFIPARYLAETQLLGFGARAEYEAVVKLPEGVAAGKWVAPLRPALERLRLRARTVAEAESNLTEAIGQLSDFLGVVGLVALLLGGIGVASGVSAFVARKIDTVAVLRCLGATSGQILLIYTLQAAAMGLVGAAVGVAIGVAIQFVLPGAVNDFLPVDVAVRLEPAAIALGLLVGLWVALVFALRPLLALRSVSPLQAIRRDLDADVLRLRWRDWPRVLVDLLLVGSVVTLALSRAKSWQQGLGFAAGIFGVLGLLWASASLLSWAARRLVRARWPYVVRQGVANLHRPANQTRAVVLSLGFGAFLVTTLFLVQSNLLERFDVTARASRANLIFFDVQEDQARGVAALARAAGHRVLDEVPIVTMRVAAIKGEPVAEYAKRRHMNANFWALRREYRSTLRDTIVGTETLTAGRWFDAPGRRPDSLPQVSLERDIARDLRVTVGDVVTWNVQGVEIRTRVTSIRDVNWGRFEPNFFAVFEPRALAAAPKMFVLLVRSPEALSVARLQRDVVRGYPNVSSIDLSLIQQTVANIVRKVSVAVRFLAIFSLAMGVPVLFSAVAATRRARVREGVLLKTLGATRAQIGRILLAEYALLGLLGSLTGMLLAFGGSYFLVKRVFKLATFTPAPVPALLIALAALALTVGIGLLSGRDVFRETPMAALREA
jgi:putative ABC transport system permease protein